MNPEAFVFIPTQPVPAKNGNDTTMLNVNVTSNGNNGKLTIDTTPGSSYDHEVVISDAVKFQIEYHFSDTNLSMDNYLLSRMHEDPEYWVPVKTVANLTKIRSLTENEQTVLEAIKESEMLILNKDETKVKRPSFVPPKPKQHKDLRRTVFLYGLSKDMANRESVVKICSEFGKVKNAYFDKLNDTSSVFSKDFNFPNKQAADSSNTNKKNDSESTQEQQQQQQLQQPQPTVGNIASLGDNDGPDRDVALVLMTKRFGGRLIRQSSVLNSTHAAAIAAAATKTVGTGLQQPMAPATTPINISQNILNGIVPPSPTPLYTHPIPNPNGNVLDFSHLRSCFVVFESQSQANKLVKLRSRAQDGIRAMHQYDFNKARKKVAAAKAKGISPVFSPAHIALALTPNHDSSKILANVVAMTPKDRHDSVNSVQSVSSVRNGLLSPSINAAAAAAAGGRVSGNNVNSQPRRSHRGSNDSFMSQGSQISNTNIQLPSSHAGPAKNDMEWQLKQENFELQRANFTLQHALQQNIDTMKQMNLLYKKPNGSYRNGNNNNNNNNNNGHSNMALSARNNQSYQRGKYQRGGHGQSEEQIRRHTYDHRPHTTKSKKQQMNLHFGDWRRNNNASTMRNSKNNNNINNNNNNNNNNNKMNDIRTFTMPVGQTQTRKTVETNTDVARYRVNKSNPQSMKNETKKVESGKLFFALEGNDEPVAPANTPQSGQFAAFKMGHNVKAQQFSKESLVSPSYQYNANNNNNNHYLVQIQMNAQH